MTNLILLILTALIFIAVYLSTVYVEEKKKENQVMASFLGHEDGIYLTRALTLANRPEPTVKDMEEIVYCLNSLEYHDKEQLVKAFERLAFIAEGM